MKQTGENMMNWISIEERFPSNDLGQYLICDSFNRVEMGIYDKFVQKFRPVGEKEERVVTHWAEVPQGAHS
jgi:hypothetical protein